MEITSIELDNFRQFRGRQLIEFARGERNVTVVYGANGRGKTGIFRALMFCLYGDDILEQDRPAPGKRPDDQIHLVNLNLLKDSGSKPATARVKLEFADGDSSFSIAREIHAVLSKGGKVVEEIGDVTLTRIGPKGNNDKITKRELVQAEVERILNSRIRSYFLFDGERIERLTRADDAQKHEVKTGIRALLRLDDLELAMRGLKKLKSKLDEQVRQHSEGELQQAENQRMKLESDISDLEAEAERKTAELNQAKRELEAISEKFVEIKAVAEKEEMRQKLLHERDSTKANLEQCFNGMREELNFSGLLVAGMEVSALHEQLQLEVDRGQLPPNIKAEFIDALIERGRCICGSCFKPSDDHARELAKFRETIAPAGTEGLVQLYADLKTARAHREHSLQKTQDYFLQWNRLRTAEAELGRRIQQLADEIKGMGGDDTKKLADTRSRLESQVERLNEAIIAGAVKKNDRQAQLENVESEIIRLSERDQRASKVRQKRDLIQSSIKKMQSIYDAYAKKVKTSLQERSTELFQTLADEATRMSLDKIKINDDYSLNVVNWAGKPILADISAGQRQVVSLSFISALISVAGGGGIYQVPLFMDTPFGRLSRDHRRALLHSLPGLASQWILLATDTEFGKLEKNYLMETGKWGRLYLLEPVAAGETRIREETIGAFNPELDAAREPTLA